MRATLRGLYWLAVDAIEAATHMFDFSDPADKLWAETSSAHGDSGKATWANERICKCGKSYRTMPPYGTLPSFEQHLAQTSSSASETSHAGDHSPRQPVCDQPPGSAPFAQGVEPGGPQHKPRVCVYCFRPNIGCDCLDYKHTH